MTASETLFGVSLRVDEQGIRRYAELTDDFNPIHVDPDYAAKTEMGGVIAHGTMSLNLIWQALEASLGRAALPDFELDIRFKRPVRVGQTVTAGGRRTDTGYDVWVRNDAGDVVIEGTANRIGDTAVAG